MATISSTVTQAGNPNANKTYTLADADMNDAIAAYQSAANASLSTPGNPVVASRNQVLSYMFDSLIKQTIQAVVQTYKTVPAVTPPPITIS